MLVRKFEGNSLEEAIGKVKSELGSSALILSTKIKPGGFLRKETVEVTAATNPPKKDATDQFEEEELIKVFPHRRQDREFVSDAPKKNDTVATDGMTYSINRERAARSSRSASASAPVPSPDRSAELYERGFRELGFSEETSSDFARRLIFDYSKRELVQGPFLQKARVRLVAGGLRSMGVSSFQSSDRWMVIGPPGSGKTSLLVKLGLTLKGRRMAVALASSDNRKANGYAELKTYARLLKAPMTTLEKNEEHKGITLIDGPSVGFRHSEDIAELEKLAKGKKTILVLDASMRLRELTRIVDRARVAGPTAIVFTKLDLNSQYGVIYDVLKYAKLPLLGLSLSRSFTTPFKFFEPSELAGFLLSPAPA